MGLKAIGDRLLTALRWRRPPEPQVIPTRTMRLPRALPPPRVRCLETEECVTGQTLTTRQADDAYWMLRFAIGISLEDRFDYYREHLLRRGTGPDEVARRLDAIRPFLVALSAIDDEAGDGDGSRISRVQVAQRPGAPGFGLRFADGTVQMLTRSPALSPGHADAQLGGGAELVWCDGDGDVSPVSIPIQEYEDVGDDDQEEEAP